MKIKAAIVNKRVEGDGFNFTASLKF